MKSHKIAYAMPKNHQRLGLYPRSRWESSRRSPKPLVGWRGVNPLTHILPSTHSASRFVSTSSPMCPSQSNFLDPPCGLSQRVVRIVCTKYDSKTKNVEDRLQRHMPRVLPCNSYTLQCWFTLSLLLPPLGGILITRQGHSNGGGYWYLYPRKSAQVNFLWG